MGEKASALLRDCKPTTLPFLTFCFHFCFYFYLFLAYSTQTNHLQLIPFVVEKIDYLPTGYEKVPQLTTDSDHFEEDAGKLCSSLVKWLETGKLEEDSLHSSVFQDFKVRKHIACTS